MNTELTLRQLLQWAAAREANVTITPDGMLHVHFTAVPDAPPKGYHLHEVAAMVTHQPHARGAVLQADGYDSLATVLAAAFDQAARGKGKERHAQGEPFTEQVMQDMARRFGVGALLGQAFKKSEESQRLPHHMAVRELLGAINYIAGAVIHMERHQPVAANDNTATAQANGR